MSANWTVPMLAELSKTLPVGDDWVFERKLDGLRCIAIRNQQSIELLSRNQLSYTHNFPDIVEALTSLPIDTFVLDGELVAFDEDHTSFASLHAPSSKTQIVFSIFDVTYLLGNDTRHLPLTDRRNLLEKMIKPVGPLRLVAEETGKAEDLLEVARTKGWEGLIAKRPESTYVAGRSSQWKKIKITVSQEMVIGGWTEPKGARVGFGALLLGHYEGDQFRFAGKVGTGFNHKLLSSLYKDLRSLEIDESPFVDEIKEKSAHWATPKLVANIEFTEWTRDGKLRHPSFLGLRTDKSAKEVVREIY